MSKHINKATGKPYKVLWFGDLITPSGFGRIGNEVTRRLARRGYEVQGASISYSGWPHDFGFHVWPLAGQDIWNALVTITGQFNPDVIVSCQDFPYHHSIWHGCRIDFSRIRWIWITPIDGTPIHPDWAKLTEYADGGMVISRFGVEAMRQAGYRVGLCHPGVNADEFYPATAEEKADLRLKAGYSPDDYIVGVVCMNQGRKAISCMIEAFHEFARDKPEARLLLDMDRISPAGWDIPNLIKQMGWTDDQQKRVKYRENLFQGEGGKPNEAMLPLRNRFALLDAHMVISHREGFGLPLLEGMAVKIPTLALDWCSGTEVMAEGRGVLVKRLAYMEHGSWGGARDAFPDMDDLLAGLNRLYDDRAFALHVAETGYEWARRQTWDVTTDQVETMIQAAFARAKTVRSHEPTTSPVAISPGLTDTFGPSHGPNGRENLVGDHPELQQLPGPGAVPAVAPLDRGSNGAGGAARDPVPG